MWDVGCGSNNKLNTSTPRKLEMIGTKFDLKSIKST